MVKLSKLFIAHYEERNLPYVAEVVAALRTGVAHIAYKVVDAKKSSEAERLQLWGKKDTPIQWC
jgi:hypothetical protein